MPNDTINDLFEIDVERIGLVGKGANQEEFFLLKSMEGNNVTNDGDLEILEALEKEALEDDNKSVWQKFMEVFTKAMNGALGPKARIAAAQAAKVLSQVPPEEMTPDLQRVQKMLLNMSGPYDATNEESNGEESTGEMDMTQGAMEKTDIVQPSIPEKKKEENMDELTKVQGTQTEDVTPATPEVVTPEPVTPKAEKTVEAVTKQDFEALRKANEALQERLEKAENEAKAERLARRRQELIAKSRERYVALPTQPEKIADLTMYLEKQEGGEEWVKWLNEFLASTDHQLVDGGLFKEFGTAEEPETTDAIAKAEKIAKDQNIDMAEALLRLSPEDQRALREHGGR